MSIRVRLAIALIAFTACASPAPAASRDGHDTFKFAQYCVPQYDDSDAVKVYC